MNMHISQKQQGFTLVELSIVIVIIGLIIGGTLAGQDLIKGAEIRATISQVEQYNTAANTFKIRYNGVPGDYRNNANLLAGITAGNGNGYLEDADNDATVNDLDGEIVNFWQHIGAASLGFQGDGATGAAAVVGDTFPELRIRPGGGVSVYHVDGLNYYQLGVDDSAASHTFTPTLSLSPEEAYQIDAKMDDGKPITGFVQAKGAGAPNQDPSDTDTAGQSGCVFDVTANNLTADDDYNVQHTMIQCSLRIRMSI